MIYTSRFVALHAVLLAAAGLLLLFMPGMVVESGGVVRSEGVLWPQLFGAALLGSAATNWIARRATLGGIYGRAIVAGSQLFSLVALLVLLSHHSGEADLRYWLFVGLVAYGLLLYGTLLLRGVRLRGPSDAPRSA